MKTKPLTIRVPIDQDPKYELPVPKGCFRCSGCNLPTSSTHQKYVYGFLVGLLHAEDTEVAVCLYCAGVAENNSQLSRAIDDVRRLEIADELTREAEKLGLKY
jgi:hypothetical protein